MRKSNLNRFTVQGRIYQQNLTIREAGPTSKNPGAPYIKGSLDIATDEDGVNVITIKYNFPVMENYSSGKKNNNFPILKAIAEGNYKTWIENGKDSATMVKIDGSLGLNDFVGSDGNMVAQKVNEGSFISVISSLPEQMSERSKFEADMVITSVSRVEANPDKGIAEDYVSLRGAIFDFKNALLPMDFSVRNPQGMKYFEDMEVSGKDPVFTKVWGTLTSITTKRESVEEAAFGEPVVRVFESKVKSIDVTGTAKVPYDFGDPEVLTAEELTKAAQDREVYLAEVKKNNEEWKANSAKSASANPAISAIQSGGFNF